MRFTDWLPYIALLVLFLPFWLFDRLLKKRQRRQRGYGDYDETWTKGYF
jgi:hypothetical protein